jgi:glycosyltransferase involved in cell wall biosynthesis
MISGKPFVTIVLAVLNGARTIQRCLDSVADQKYLGWELIVQDGGSTDGSVEILKANAQRIAYWESGPDKGPSDAANKAIRRARGEWICFLGSDDYLWDSSVLERLVPHLRHACPPCRVVYGRLAVVLDDRQVLEYLGEPWDRFKRGLIQGKTLPGPAVIYHRSLFDVHGLFDSSFIMAGDYEFQLRALRTEEALFVPDVVVAGFQYGGLSSVPENALLNLFAVRKAQRKNGVRFPGVLWIGWVLRVCLRLAIWRLLGAERAKPVLDWGRAILGKGPFWTRI